MIPTLQRWWTMPDHYYWMTAILAARGSQRATSTTVSIYIGLMAVLPVLMVFSPAGPRWGWPVLAVGIAAVCSLAIAALWQRGRWPTRTESRVNAVVLAACIAVVSIVMANPVSSIVTSMSFAALASYVIFLHAPRYVAAVLLAAAATIAVPFVELAASGDIVWAVCLTAFAAMIIVAVSLVSLMQVQLLGIESRHSELEPLTGLLTRSALSHGAADLIGARSRQDDRYLVIVVASLDDHSELAGVDAVASEQARVNVAQTLRECTRANTLLAHLNESEFVVVDIFQSSDASPLTGRMRSAIKSTPPHLSASIGVVSTPMEGLSSCPPEELIDELLELAVAAVQEAQSSGGDCTTATVCQRPLTLDRIAEPFDDAI